MKLTLMTLRIRTSIILPLVISISMRGKSWMIKESMSIQAALKEEDLTRLVLRDLFY